MAGEGPYGTEITSTVEQSATISGPANAARARTENWVVRPETGGELKLDLAFTSGRHAWASGEARPTSAVSPDFHRIYRYDRLIGLIMSEEVGKPLAGTVTFDNSIAELDGILTADARLMGVFDVPVYVVRVSLP